MKISHLASVVVLGMASAAVNAATVWAPTNVDTDFLQFNFLGISTNGGALALFDDADFGGAALVIGSAGGQVTFTASGADFNATFSGGGSITLTGGASFTLGVSWDGGLSWFGDSSYALSGGSPDTYAINFDGIKTDNVPVTATTIAVDLQPVPVPAAMWLFGSGLLGLVGVARRRA